MKLERHGVGDGAARVRDAGLRVTNLIGLGPFQLADPRAVAGRSGTGCSALEAGVTVGAECLVVTTGPAGPLPWEDAADRFAEALEPVLRASTATGIPFALEHTNSLRVDVGFVHTLRDVSTSRRRLDIGVCMEINACWAERGLAATIAAGVDRIRLVQVSDFAVGTLIDAEPARARRRRHPARPHHRAGARRGYAGCFDLELIGRRSRPRATSAPFPARSPRSTSCSRHSRPEAQPSQVTGPKWKPLVASSAAAAGGSAPGQVVSRSSAGK